jgi:hypothetical protein
MLYITENNEIKIQDIPIQTFFNNLLRKTLTDLHSREHVTKKALGFKSKIPIYIDQESLFMCLNSYRLEKSLYINYFSIKSFTYIDNFVIIHFFNKTAMKLNNKYAFQNQLEKCLLILDYIK